MKVLSKSKKPVSRLAKNQLSSLILTEKIITTQNRAKTLKQEAQSMIQLLKSTKDNLILKRKLKNLLYGQAVNKAYDLKDRLESISTYRIEKRTGDNAQMLIVELNLKKQESKKDPEKKKK